MILVRVEFARGAAMDQRTSGWRLSDFAPMPTGLVEDEDGVRARRDLGGNVVEMKLTFASALHTGSTRRSLFRARADAPNR